MPTDQYEGVQRLREVSDLVSGIQKTYPDAKRVNIDIHFEWVNTGTYEDGAELCPVVKINIER